MKKILLLLIVTILQISCKDSKVLDDNQEAQIYSLINDYILDSIYHSDLISIETMKFDNGMNNDTSQPLSFPGDFYEFKNTFFDSLFKAKIIDSSDIKSIINQFAQTKQLFLDPSKLETRTFSLADVDKKIENGEIQKSHAYDFLKENYNARSFIKFSFPIFLKDNQLIILSVMYRCGSTCGEGADYVFRKMNGKWIIVFKEVNWIS